RPSGRGPFTSPCAWRSATWRSGSWNFRPLLAAAVPTTPPGVVFLQGLTGLRLDSCGAGQSVAITLEYPQEVPPTAVFWRFGPTPDDRSAHWYVRPGPIASHGRAFTLV